MPLPPSIKGTKASTDKVRQSKAAVDVFKFIIMVVKEGSMQKGDFGPVNW